MARMLKQPRQPVTRGKTGATLGLMSAALLFASLRWAHEWGPRTDAIVASWALATVAAFVVSWWSLHTSWASRRFAAAGLALALVSVLAVPVVGVLYAVGVDVEAACGGG
jgi:hypothetical protein